MAIPSLSIAGSIGDPLSKDDTLYIISTTYLHLPPKHSDQVNSMFSNLLARLADFNDKLNDQASFLREMLGKGSLYLLIKIVD